MCNNAQNGLFSGSVLSDRARLCWKCGPDKLPGFPVRLFLRRQFSLSTFSGPKTDRFSVTPGNCSRRTVTCEFNLTHEHRFLSQQLWLFFPPLRFRYAQHSDGTLTISSLKADDAGLYTCTASTQQQLEQRQLQLKVQSEFIVYLWNRDKHTFLSFLPCVRYHFCCCSFTIWTAEGGVGAFVCVHSCLPIPSFDKKSQFCCFFLTWLKFIFVQLTWGSPQLPITSRWPKAARPSSPAWCQETTSASAGPGSKTSLRTQEEMMLSTWTTW